MDEYTYEVVALSENNKFLLTNIDEFDFSKGEWKCAVTSCEFNFPIPYSSVVQIRSQQLEPSLYGDKYIFLLRQFVKEPHDSQNSLNRSFKAKNLNYIRLREGDLSSIVFRVVNEEGVKYSAGDRVTSVLHLKLKQTIFPSIKVDENAFEQENDLYI